MMKLIRTIFVLMMLTILTACGGGGGSPGNTSGKALFTTAPGTIQISPGEIKTFSISGGVPAYSATSSSGAASVKVSNTILTITGGGGGATTVIIKDAAGVAISIDVTVGSGLALFTTAPSSITLATSAISSEYSIGGGSLLYTVTSSNIGVASVNFNGTRFVVSGISGGKAVISVRDSIGAIVSIDVVVGSTNALFSTAASSINVAVGVASVYTVGGGSGPYVAGSSNPAIVSAAISGSKLTITGNNSGTAIVVIHDSTAGSIDINVTVGASGILFTTAPASLTIASGSASPEFSIGGGSQVYTISSSNSLVASVGINGNKFIINGVSTGATTVEVKDSVGATQVINVTVSGSSSIPFYTTAPQNINVALGTTGSYVVGGGTGPYTATSSNASISTASIAGSNLLINGLILGKTSVLLRDTAGQTITINVTVGSGITNGLYTTAPSAVTISQGATAAPTYLVGGGIAPYIATSSNTAVATAQINGTSLTVTGLAVGIAKISVRDTGGDVVTFDATVAASGGGAAVPLYTTAPSAITLAQAASPTYTIGGGTAPYSVSSSDVKTATVTVANATMTINGIAPGAVKIFITDNVGAQKTIDVTVLGTTSIAMAVTPSTATAYVGDILTFRVDGGTAPYTVISNNPAIATITNGAILNSSGNFTVFLAKAIATGVNIVIADAKGITQTVSIVVAAPSSNLFLSPVAWTISENNSAAVNLTITGGNGPFQVFTSNTVLSSVSGSSPQITNPLTFDGRIVTVALGTQANRCVAADTLITITVIDSLNKSTTSTMTIKDNSPTACP